MQTTALFVEQVLIGAMVLAAFLLPSHEWVRSWFDPANTPEAVGVGVAFVGSAYLIGILADRAIDTLFSKLEAWARLQFALISTTSYGAGVDRFPEGTLRTLVMTEPGLSEYANYLRIRIRLSRAIAALAPTLAGAGVLAAIDDLELRRRWGLWLIVLHASALMARERAGLLVEHDEKTIERRDPGDQEDTGTSSDWLQEVPPTSSQGLEAYRDCSATDVGLLVFLGLVVSSEMVAAAWHVHHWMIAVPLLGAGVSLLAWSTWSRIQITFYRHLENSFRVLQDRKV
jgi:hypothetical protein